MNKMQKMNLRYKKTIATTIALIVISSMTCFAEEPITYGTTNQLGNIEEIISDDFASEQALEENKETEQKADDNKEDKQKPQKQLEKTTVISTVYATQNGNPIKKYTLYKKVSLKQQKKDLIHVRYKRPKKNPK